jgi:hypothetical protein
MSTQPKADHLGCHPFLLPLRVFPLRRCWVLWFAIVWVTWFRPSVVVPTTWEEEAVAELSLARTALLARVAEFIVAKSPGKHLPSSRLMCLRRLMKSEYNSPFGISQITSPAACVWNRTSRCLAWISSKRSVMKFLPSSTLKRLLFLGCYMSRHE